MNLKKTFLSSKRPHVLMITNHGLHHWDIIPGLPDTGGQNVFVNQFTATMAKKGFKITIANRGGYVHPVTGENRIGYHYKDENQRILYLEDGFDQFVRKEDMDERLPLLAKALIRLLDEEETSVDLIISHYWDGAKLGVLYNQSLSNRVKHIWVPHSLGAVKKKNINPDQWHDLRIDERIAVEKNILSVVDNVTATSAIITQALKEDYKYESSPLFLPPCVNIDRFYPHALEKDHQIWRFLAEHINCSPEQLQKSTIITEISRTDSTKRKDVLIKAFGEVNKEYSDTVLVVSIDQTNKVLARELGALIESLGLSDRIITLGSVWDELPDIYAATDIYCTPSVMEGFGMTSQEAAAMKVPVVASHLVPFATEYLCGKKHEDMDYGEEGRQLLIGEGAIIVPADDITGFREALLMLLNDSSLRKNMGEKAYEITIPYFTWDNSVRVFLEEGGFNNSFKEIAP